MATAYDICRLADGGLVVVLQDRMHDALATRIVAPLIPLARTKRQPDILAPVVDFAETPHVLLVASMSAVPLAALRRPAGNISHQRDDIVRALDLLFTGI